MASQKTAHNYIVRQKNASYLWVIDPSTNDTDFVDRGGFDFDPHLECRGQVLRVMKIDGVKFCIGRLAIGQRIAVKNEDGSLLLKDGIKKFTYQPSTEWKWGSIYYFPPSQPVQVIPGHIDLRNYYAEDGSLTGKDLYDLIGDIVRYYNTAKQPQPTHPVIMPQSMIMPPFTPHDYQAWHQFQAFMQWQHQMMQYHH